MFQEGGSSHWGKKTEELYRDGIRECWRRRRRRRRWEDEGIPRIHRVGGPDAAPKKKQI